MFSRSWVFETFTLLLLPQHLESHYIADAFICKHQLAWVLTFDFKTVYSQNFKLGYSTVFWYFVFWKTINTRLFSVVVVLVTKVVLLLLWLRASQILSSAWDWRCHAYFCRWRSFPQLCLENSNLFQAWNVMFTSLPLFSFILHSFWFLIASVPLVWFLIRDFILLQA